MHISQRCKKVRVSGTVKLSQMARDLRASGRDIIDLAEGEPDFDTPLHVIEAACTAAHSGETRYTPVAGTQALRNAIAASLASCHSLNFDPSQIIVGSGAKQLIFNALLATIDPGDEVIVPAPYWVSYPDMVQIADGIPVTVACTINNNYKLDPSQLESAITARTRWLILNSPCNPTGAVYSATELQALADVLRLHPQVGVMCDDIYQHIVFDAAQFATLAAVAPDLGPRVLLVNGVSKTYAMTGWRIGYAAGTQTLIDAMAKLQGQSTTNACSVSQAAAVAALQGSQDFLQEWLETYATRRTLVIEALSDTGGLTVHKPAGAFYCFFDCSSLLGKTDQAGKVITSDQDVTAFLLGTAGVALVPGSEFGAPGHLRLCFAQSNDVLTDACLRIRRALETLV